MPYALYWLISCSERKLSVQFTAFRHSRNCDACFRTSSWWNIVLECSNECAQTSYLMLGKIEKFSLEVLPHPQCSLDTALSDCCEMLSESSRLLLLYLPRWKKMRREAKVTLPQASRISVPHDTILWTGIDLHECFLDFMFQFVCNGWQNWATCLD
jgi:hypothetical protein